MHSLASLCMFRLHVCMYMYVCFVIPVCMHVRMSCIWGSIVQKNDCSLSTEA